MAFVATACSIVSGALAERIKIWPFFLFCAVLTGFIYPIVGAWTWGGGWLSELGFSDFAGSTIVHSVGGWAALTGAILLGARKGRFRKKGESVIRNSNLPIVGLGVFILWFGWFGFNGGSQLAIGTADDAMAVAKILANTNMAAAGGVLAVLGFYGLQNTKIDLGMVMNGALAGLVAITAEPLAPSIALSVVIGAVGGLVMMAASAALERLKIDDVVGAVPVHLAAGIWGTLAVCLSNAEANILIQMLGIVVVGAFVGVISFALWAVMRTTIGIRLRWSAENIGGDLAELGVRAYHIGDDAQTYRPASLAGNE